MSLLSEHQANENAPEVHQQSANSAREIRTVLQDFDVLFVKADTWIFKYAYLYFIGCFLLAQLWEVPRLFQPNGLSGAYTSLPSLTSQELLFIVGACLVLWTFNVWRKQVPKTLQDIVEKNCISVHSGDHNTRYLAFLKQYRDALRNPKRYLLSALLISAMVIYALFSYYPFIRFDLVFMSDPLRIILDLMALLLTIMVEIGFLYCLGIILWSLFVSGQYISRFAHMFELNIEPVHPDGCGGLHELGNLCFTAASPLIIGSAFFVGWTLVGVHFVGPDEIDRITVLFIFSIILLFVLPIAFYILIRPLINIHTNMLRKREKDEEHYVGELVTLREKIQMLLDANELVEAKNMKEKKEIKEALYIPYPTWPFNLRTKIFTTFLGAGGSLLLGVLTALTQPLAQEILRLLKPGK